MSSEYATATANAILQAIADKIDADTNPGKIKIYKGTRPATGVAADSGNLVATHVLTKPCGTVSAGVLTFDTINDDSAADVSGDMTWCRVEDGAGNCIRDGSVAYWDGVAGHSGETAFLRFRNTVTAVAGVPVRISSLTMTV